MVVAERSVEAEEGAEGEEVEGAVIPVPGVEVPEEEEVAGAMETISLGAEVDHGKILEVAAAVAVVGTVDLEDGIVAMALEEEVVVAMVVARAMEEVELVEAVASLTADLEVVMEVILYQHK